MSVDKRELRQVAKDRRLNLAPGVRAEKARQIRTHLLPLLETHDPILTYVSKEPEVDTRELIQCLLASGKHIVVPIIERQTVSLRLTYLEHLHHLVESTFHVPEPIGHEIPARAEDVTVAVIPMLAFDPAGNRLGYGAGYYDRFLIRHRRVVKIGVAFSCQQVDAIPADANDVRMDWIVTEDGAIRCNHSGDPE
ncbi:MAG: 5-formyltetrahydrofolate cyclo-ligase [Methanomicrobiales archaeon]|nr:5-formyltetrahydrofolate cyclo-ligase [Methanomicrobiales archaeon]MDI6876526.1 5-formyltetrahydrofolate cyclo-ligase [Methanomicrobiales archaeon]